MELIRAVIFFVAFLVAVCSGLPARSIKDDVESVRPVNTYGDQPIVDTGYFTGWDNPFSSNSFVGLFDNLESVMERMRQQIASLLNKFPVKKGTNSSDDLPTFPGFINGVDLPGFPNIGDIDLSKGNSTSIKKVIDGHTVVINETEYKNEDDFGGTFFKVRIIDVKPDSSELTTEKEAEAVPENVTEDTKDREEIENSFENEIPKSRETEKSFNTENHDNIGAFDNNGKIDDKFDNIETFEEVDSIPSIVQNQGNTPIDSVENLLTTNKNSEWSEEEEGSKMPDTEWGNIGPVLSVDSNAIEPEDDLRKDAKQRPFDLSKDTYVNEIMAKNGAPVDPDAEVFFVAQNPAKTSRFEQIIDPR